MNKKQEVRKKKMNKNIRVVIVSAVIIAFSVFTAAIPSVASEPSNTPLTAESAKEIDGITPEGEVKHYIINHD